jgi:uncharacterized protein (DUF58 family)
MKNFLWILIPLVGVLLAFVLKSPYVSYSIYAFILLVALANLSSRAWLAGLDCEREIDVETVQQGQAAQIEVRVTNRRGFPIPWIYVEDMIPPYAERSGDHSRLATLMPGRSLLIQYKLTFPRRGYHRIGPMMMESGDVFGLQKRFKSGRRQDYVSVLPTIAYIDTFNVASKRPMGPVKSTNKIYEDPSLLNGLREYQPGDPLNRIDWKASARTDELVTKIFDPTTVTGGTLILDLHADSYKPEEADLRQELAITTTASIAYLLQMSGEQLGMVTNGLDAAEIAEYEIKAKRELSREEIENELLAEQDSNRLSPLQVPTQKSPIQAQIIIENLARIRPGYGLNICDMLLEEFRGLPRDATLIPVVPYVDEKLAITLAEMKMAGFSVSVFLIRDKKHYADAAGLLARHQIHVFHIQEEGSLHEISPQKIGH